MGTGTVESRFWAKVEKTEGCWIWQASTSGQGRYGYFYLSGRGPTRVRVYAHRWAYESLVGPIPEGYEIDHLCRNRLCVNPAHLEPVDHATNRARGRGIKYKPQDLGEFCRNGHARSENTRTNSQGWRVCVLCNREKTARHRAKQQT